MGSNVDANVFKCVDDNKSYTFNATLYTGSRIGADDGQTAGLDTNDLEEFVYETKLNGLLLTGHVIYTDKYARVDQFMSQHYTYCEVMMCVNIEDRDGMLGVTKLDKTQMFKHTFIVNDIKILARAQGVIKYRIDLVSNNWFNCIANVEYSNYDRDPVELFTVLRECFRLVDLKVDDESFNRVKSSVSLNYITNVNDCMLSVIRYLLPKTFYFRLRDSGMKFLMYNETTDKFQLLDITNKDTANGIFSEVVSFFKTDLEGLAQPKPMNLGYIKHSPSKTDIYKSMLQYDMHEFSYDSNEFSVNKISPQETVKFMNERLIGDGHESMYSQMFSSVIPHYTAGSYWNNMQFIYDDIASTFQAGDSFVVNTKGEILRKPGSIMNIAVDRSMKDIDSMSKEQFEREKKKYKFFDGQWFVSKVQHVISPMNRSYRQCIALFRNFRQKTSS